MRRSTAILAVLLALNMICPAQAIGTNASCAILMDAESGRVLYAQNVHQPRLIASITKLMTALVAAEQAEDMDEVVTIKGEWLGSEGSSIYLTAGEEISLRGLMYGLLLQSGNDAAMAIACHIAGSEADFVALMNQKAAELGMKDSSFANPSGLNHEDHFSTAYDMALLAQACLENETVAQICATRSITVGTRTFVNHNKLLYRFEGCVGMKTGFTEKAGRTLVSAATRDGQTLICVTLNDGDDWNDHMKLLDYGFQTYPRQVLCGQGDAMGPVMVEGSLVPAVTAVTAKEIGYPLASGETLTMDVGSVGPVQAPFEAGLPLGQVIWKMDGEVVAKTDLVAQSGAGLDVREPLTLWQQFKTRLGMGASFPALS